MVYKNMDAVITTMLAFCMLFGETCVPCKEELRDGSTVFVRDSCCCADEKVSARLIQDAIEHPNRYDYATFDQAAWE